MLGSNLELDYYWYNDEYMYFSFNGHHSSKYHLFIQNTKDLTIENSIGAASEYSNAMLQEGTYYLGTSRKQKTFKRKCAAELNNLQDYKRMMKWLTVGTVGELVFDSDRDWGWTVVLDTVGDTTYIKRGNSMVVEFELTFKTIGTYLAHNVYPAAWIMPRPSFNEDGTIIGYTYDAKSAYVDVIHSNKYLIPVVIANSYDIPTGSMHKYYLDMYIQDLGNIKQEVIIAATPQNVLMSGEGADTVGGPIGENFKLNFYTIEENIDPDDDPVCTTFLTAEFNPGEIPVYHLEYNSQSSTLYINHSIAEEYVGCIKTTQQNGLLKIKSEEPVELELNTEEGIQVNNNTITIKLTDDSWNEFYSGNYDYITVQHIENASTYYSVSPYANYMDYENGYNSWTGFKESLDVGTSAYYGDYTLNTSNKSITIEVNSKINVEIDNTPKIYCGKTKMIRIEMETQSELELPVMVQVTSYNNL